MTELRLAARAKINLGLEVLGRRADGYHQIATVFQEVDLADTLRIAPAADLRLQVVGTACPAGEENLVWRAAQVLREATGCRRGARLHLRKRIPVGAGLGGGSSDAAAALRGLDRMWDTRVGREDLLKLAADLGSDVPFFLVGGTVLGLGRGELVCPLPDLPTLGVLVVFPRQPLSTAEVYSRARFGLTVSRNCNTIRRFARYSLTGRGLDELVRNDLERTASELLPVLRRWPERLRRAGALAAALSGSGSAVYGLFPSRASAAAAAERLQGPVDRFACAFRRRG